MILGNYTDSIFDKIESLLRHWIDGHEELQQNLLEMLNLILSIRFFNKLGISRLIYFGRRPNGQDKSHSDIYLKKDCEEEWFFPIAEIKTSKVLPEKRTKEIIKM